MDDLSKGEKYYNTLKNMLDELKKLNIIYANIEKSINDNKKIQDRCSMLLSDIESNISENIKNFTLQLGDFQSTISQLFNNYNNSISQLLGSGTLKYINDNMKYLSEFNDISKNLEKAKEFIFEFSKLKSELTEYSTLKLKDEYKSDLRVNSNEKTKLILELLTEYNGKLPCIYKRKE